MQIIGLLLVEREVIDCEIILSKSAEKMLKHLMEDKALTLFITVRGGGCSGYVYDLDLRDEEPTNEHQILQQNDIIQFRTILTVPFCAHFIISASLVEVW